MVAFEKKFKRKGLFISVIFRLIFTEGTIFKTKDADCFFKNAFKHVSYDINSLFWFQIMKVFNAKLLNKNVKIIIRYALCFMKNKIDDSRNLNNLSFYIKKKLW